MPINEKGRKPHHSHVLREDFIKTFMNYPVWEVIGRQ